MRMRKTAALMIAVFLGFMPPHLDAARGPVPAQPRRLELLVIEVKGCNVCDLVRTYIQPAYEATPRSKAIPMRYVDITHIDEMKLGLNTPVSTVPTIVLMQDGHEIERISGYTGPTNFFAALTQMVTLLEP
ncbi:MAG: hypothetical protein ACK5JT_02075 [Hyphomicrobiaceae bacterium]